MSEQEQNERQLNSDLPSLDETYPLQPEQITAYQQNGHIYLPRVCLADELAAYRPCIADTVEMYRKNYAPLEERDTYGKAFLQIMNLWRENESVRKYVLARRFAKIAADLMGVSGVRIYHDQALFKEPGGGHTPWHQDQYYWPLDTSNTITMWMPLTDIPMSSGSMTFISGSQRYEYAAKMGISDDSDSFFTQFVEENNLSFQNYGAFSAGDVTFHSGWTMHNAPANPSSQMREAMTIIYFADGTKVAEPDSKNRHNDLKSWLPGLSPGDLAASVLNPLVYDASA